MAIKKSSGEIVMQYDFNQLGYQLTKSEFDLMALMLANLPDQGSYQKSKQRVCFEDYLEITKEKTQARRNFADACKRIVKRHLFIKDNASGYKEGCNAMIVESWFFHSSFDYIDYCIAPTIWNYAVDLKDKWISVKLWEIADLESMYGKRLFFKLRQFAHKKEFTYAIKEINWDYQLKKSYSSNSALVKSRVIMPAIEDINSNSTMTVKMKPMKKKNKVIGFSFKVEKEKKEEISTQSKFDPKKSKHPLLAPPQFLNTYFKAGEKLDSSSMKKAVRMALKDGYSINLNAVYDYHNGIKGTQEKPARQTPKKEGVKQIDPLQVAKNALGLK